MKDSGLRCWRDDVMLLQMRAGQLKHPLPTCRRNRKISKKVMSSLNNI